MDDFLPLSWVEPSDIQISPEIKAVFGDQSFLCRSLARIGIHTVTEAQKFLSPETYQPADPDELPDLKKATMRILTAIAAHEKIGIWGDFDADGQTATTVLFQTLNILGADVIYHIPDRETEGHGIPLDTLKAFIQQGIRVLLSCDTGVSALLAVEYANQKGVDCIITDHHKLPDRLPEAYAIINPQRLEANHPLRTLAGVGVAYKLAEALLKQTGKEKEALNLLDLVAIGTVADLAELKGDTRYLVQLGLQQLNNTLRLGLLELFKMIALNQENINEEQISFAIAPRLNALGRLENANPMVEFLTTDDLQFAKVFSYQLEVLNNRRKFESDQVFEGTLTKIKQNPQILSDPIIILNHPNWPGGVVGIVASRLVEKFHKPAILLTSSPNGHLHGSARSIEGFDITEAISAAGEYLISFGGHAMAAGLALEEANLNKFKNRINQFAGQNFNFQFNQPTLWIDSYLSFSEINNHLVDQIDLLAPFGSGNPAPVFATKDVNIERAIKIGKSGDHRQLIIEDSSGASRKVIWWQGAGQPLPDQPFDLAYTLRKTNFRGNEEIQMVWVDARISENLPKAAIKPEKEYHLHDFRDITSLEAAFNLLEKHEHSMIWGEGMDNLPESVCTREQLDKNKSLVLLTIPANIAILREILQAVEPQEISIFSFTQSIISPQDVLQKLAGMIKYVVNRRAGIVSIHEISYKIGLPTAIILKGLEWLEAKGYCKISNYSDEPLFIQVPGQKSPAQQINIIENDLTILIREVKSFQNFYLTAELEDLFSITNENQERRK